VSENKDIQGKSTQVVGLKKSIHKSVLKDGEYHHLKNGTISSFEGDIPFIQNMPSNLECVTLPNGYKVLNSDYIKERNYHVLYLINFELNKSEIGFFYGNECKYETKLNQGCLNFNIAFPIKSQYKIKNCELHLYFQDGFNPDRHINLDDLPFKKQLVDGCYVDTDVFDCSAINVQNDLIPPVVKPKIPIEAGALFTGVYQFAVCYANINGNEQSSYYSKTNPLPIYEDRFSSYENTEGSKANQLTDKAIPVEFSNLDIRYDYINLAVIKTVQGTPTYELIATLPISTKDYIYTGREITKLLSIDRILGLYPDYYNSKTITSANNYLIRANMSTQDEANYQPFANLIELEWAVVRKKADSFESTYKNPLNSVEYKGYQRGEVYAFGIQYLLTNGRKTSVFHIPGRKSKPSDLIKYTKDNIPVGEECNFFELTNDDSCTNIKIDEIYHWQIYDTATITEQKDETLLTKCDNEVIMRGDFAYWESTDTYSCNSEVYQNLSGQKIRHHKFPTNNTVHHHNQPYTYSVSGDSEAYSNNNTYIYPIGVQLKNSLNDYIQIAITKGILTQEEASLIAGYEIVRGDRTGNKSIIAKGLLYNMNYYIDVNPSTNISEEILYPNYPFNDLREDKYLNNDLSDDYSYIVFEVTTLNAFLTGDTIPFGSYGNPFPTTFTLDRDVANVESFTITYQKSFLPPIYGEWNALFKFYGADRTLIDDFLLREGDESNFVSSSKYKKDLFTFHSPDTFFKKPFLGQELNLHSIEFGASEGRFDQVEGHPEFKPANQTDSANYACAYKAIGNYNNYVSVSNTNLRRKLEDSSYLVGNNFTKLPDTSTKINNRFRESSVGLRLNCDLDDPTIEDQSRYTISQNNQCDCKAVIEDRILDYKNAFEVDSQCTTDNKWISSYYGSLKTKIPNQYGQIDTIKYVLTGSYHNVYDTPSPIFGGDTFITRFTLKRKNSFFNVNFIGMSPVGITYKGTKYANLLTPVYHADNEKGGALGEYKIDFSTSKLDCNISGGVGKGDRNGFFYLFSTGIVNFFVESDVNTELRYSGANIWDTWYPKLKNTNVWDFMEEKKSTINYDNSYLYNFDYSKQNIEEALFPQIPDFKPNSECKNTHPRRIIYSKQDNEENSADNWLVYPANNYVDLDSYLGSIIDIKALDTFKVLVRCENGSLVFNAFDTLQLEQTSVTVGTGGMFSQRPQTFAETDTGYAGSQSKYAINTSQYGTFFPEFKRGRVFHYNSQLEEISNNGMFDWFQENMPFKIQVANVNTDNPYTGIGYNSVYDNRLNLWFLTKKDYKLKNLKELGNITLDENNNILYKGTPTNFLDTKIWKNVGWTISYSPLYKSWISFHSFQPNYYINGIENFYTGLQNQTIYKHWDKFSFQTYYKTLSPFEITITTSNEQVTSILQSIEYNLKIQKYLNNNYQDLYENHKVNFNEAIVSTDNQSSGLLNLIKKDNQDPYQTLKYPIRNIDSVNVLYSKIEGHKYRVNQFSDLVLDKNNNVPIFLHDENGVDSVPNNIDYTKQFPQKLRNEFFDVTLINDTLSEYKFILKSLINKTIKSIR
jgi:hypothetical protein